MGALNLGLSRPMGQMRLCVECAVIRERVGTHSSAADKLPATTDISGPQEGSAHLATAIEGCIAHGVLCRRVLLWPLISCCGPQTRSQSVPLAPICLCLLVLPPAPSSAHSARTLVHVQVHVHVHIRTALPTSFLLSSGVFVLVLVLVMGCWLIVHVRLPLLCPAALQPAPHHAAWSRTGQPILSVPGPPPGRKSGSRTEPALHSKLATPSHHSPSARLCVKRL